MKNWRCEKCKKVKATAWCHSLHVCQSCYEKIKRKTASDKKSWLDKFATRRKNGRKKDLFILR